MAKLKTPPAPAGRPTTTAPAADAGPAPSALIDARIKELQDWRGATLSWLRGVIRSAVPDVTEEWKWNVPVWSCDGILCTGESYKKVVKLTFPHGASLSDPSKLFNSSLDGKVRRAIDFPEGGEMDEAALSALLQAAALLNKGLKAGRAKRAP
jgi:hypothetical protein